MDNQRNLLLAVVLCGLLLFGWDFAINRMYPQPAEEVRTEQVANAAAPAKDDKAKPRRTRKKAAAPEVSPPADKPWSRRRQMSRIGAKTPMAS